MLVVARGTGHGTQTVAVKQGLSNCRYATTWRLGTQGRLSRTAEYLKALMCVQMLAIEHGMTDSTARSLLHNHLTFHYMTDPDMLAALTCVAEWEAGFVADVLPCFKYSGLPMPI